MPKYSLKIPVECTMLRVVTESFPDFSIKTFFLQVKGQQTETNLEGALKKLSKSSHAHIEPALLTSFS